MPLTPTLRAILLSVACALAGAASAQVRFNIQIGPPAPLYEEVPMMAPGYVWAPGYWAWHEDRHIWIRGRSMVARNGYRWQPDVWEQRDNRYYRNPGRWERDNNYRAPPRAQMNRNGPDDRNARPGNRNGNNGNGNGNGRNKDGRPGRGNQPAAESPHS